jgi:uncharacterized protein YgbK (DUF1537 family)
MAPRYAWYGDDFTGATDTLATLAAAGLRCLLFLRPEDAAQRAAGADLDAVGIAGAARAMTPVEMQAELTPVGDLFARLGAALVHYKCCSTFDSAVHVGSIGTAVAALRQPRMHPLVAIVGGQPSLGRYCLFSNLFAAAGAGGAVERIDRHPTMMRHPVTPMRESDLRLHLGAQGLIARGIHYPQIAAGALDALMAAEAADGPGAVLLDVSRETDLAAIGAALWRTAASAPLLCIGASSVAQAALAAWPERTAAPAAPPTLGAAQGPVFVLAGSLSPVTRAQIEAARAHFTVMAVNGDDLLGGNAAILHQAEGIATALGSGQHVLFATPTDTVGGGDRARSDRIAASSAALLAEVLRRARPRRIGIAGGDTSSRAVLGLPAWGLGYRASLGPGVAVSRLHSDEAALDGLEIMLKGGQMGATDVFTRLLG